MINPRGRRMTKVFRFNWNIKTFPFEVCKTVYEESQRLDKMMFWRHRKDVRPRKDDPCFFWLGTSGTNNKRFRKLRGVIGVGQIADDEEYKFKYEDETTPKYLTQLKDIKSPKHFENMMFSKVKVIFLAFDKAIVSKEEATRLFDNDIYKVSGNGCSNYINDAFQEIAKRLIRETALRIKKSRT